MICLVLCIPLWRFCFIALLHASWVSSIPTTQGRRSTSLTMQAVLGMFIGALFGVCLSLPAIRQATPPPSNSLACASVYHGKCIDTYQYQCMGIAIPGVCGNLSHFNSIDFGSMTAIQCCNGWSINNVGHGSGQSSLIG